jgi:hypothetical protein
MPLFGPPNVEKLSAKGDVQGLVKALGYEKDPSVQKAASQALAQLGEKAVEPLLLALKSAGEEGKKDAIVAALTQIGTPALEPLIEALGDESSGAYATEVLGRMGQPAVERLLAIVTEFHGPSGPKIRAATALGMIGENLEDESLREQIVNLLACRALYFDNMTSTRPKGWPAVAVGNIPDLEQPCYGALIRMGDVRTLHLMSMLAFASYMHQGMPELVFRAIAAKAGTRAIEPILAIIEQNPTSEHGNPLFQEPGTCGVVFQVLAELATGVEDNQLRDRVLRVLLGALRSGSNRALQHAKAALQTMTGQDFPDAQGWQQWWEAQK